MEIVSTSRSIVGESPFWDARKQALYWVDLRGCWIRRLDLRTTHESEIKTPELACGVVSTNCGGLIAALETGLFRFAGRDCWTRAARPHDLPPTHRFNDVTVDPAGRLIAGTMRQRQHGDAPTGTLYSFDGACWRTLAEGFRTINGLAFSPDGGRLYFSDSHASVSEVWVCDYDVASGGIGPRRSFARLDPASGRPDGAAMDSEAHYWIAAVGGGRLLRFAPDGAIERIVATPVRFPTKVAFGGTDLGTLYCTSMRAPSPDDAHEYDGALFAYVAPAAGVPVPCFGAFGPDAPRP